MSDVDNPEVEAVAAATEGQSQGALLGGGAEAQPTGVAAEEVVEATTDWKSTLPDDLKSAKSLASIKSVEDLAKGFVNAQGVIGRRFEDLSPEQIKEFYSHMGAPESADGYELTAPEGLELDGDLIDWYKNTAHELGIPKESAEKLFSAYAEMQAQGMAQTRQLKEIQSQEDFKSLQKDFGPAFDERVELANRALKEFGGEEAIKAIQEAGLSNNPVLVKLLANAGETLAEGKFTSGQNTGKFGMTSEEATNQITSLRNDPEFMKHYANPASPKHNDALSKMQDLYKIKVNAG